MQRQVLKDERLRIIGYIETAPDGKQTAKDSRLHIVGHYDPRTNITHDDRLKVVGHGNLLATLL